MAEKQPGISSVIIPKDGPDKGKAKPVAPMTDFVINQKQFLASIAAQAALDKGKSIEEAVKIAETEGEKAEEVIAKQEEAEEANWLAREYVICLAHLGHGGQFDRLSTERLTRIAALIDLKIRPLQDWTEIVKRIPRG